MALRYDLGQYEKGFRDGKDDAVHAKWEEWYPPRHMIFTREKKLYRCSSCDAKYSDVEGYRYCPYCGAKMDGGEEDG